MVVMRCRRILVERMTLQADAVAGNAQLGAVRLVAIAAGDAGREHLALLERAVIVDLVAHLPVGVIEPAGKRRNDVRIGKRAARDPVLGKPGAARVAQPARLGLLAQPGGCDAARGIAGPRIDGPGDIAALIETNQQSPGRVIIPAERPPALLRSRPADVTRALAVAGLAADADLREARGKAVVRRVVVLAHAGGVALGAHEVPVLVQPGPMQDVVVLDLFVRVEVEPALAAL